MGDAGPSTETLSPARAGLLVRRFRLRVLQGPDAGVCFESQGERVTLGTHKRCDMTLTDPAASRFNCEIALGGQGAVITDLESRNGTLVDGVSILSAHLVDGAVLTIGRTRIRFELGDERIPIPLSDRDRFGLLVGRSTPMRATFELLSRAAASDVPVLLHGETGTGKELAAESIHRESERRDEPFVVLDCSAVPGGLLESEIFGHERGAFTDAIRQRAGVFEAAGGGTVFLDEIGELEPSLQRKLLSSCGWPRPARSSASAEKRRSPSAPASWRRPTAAFRPR
jgi:two-component system, NtrC family, response regulator GlrR